MKTNLKARYEAPAAQVLEINTKASVMTVSNPSANQGSIPGYGGANEVNSPFDPLF